MLSFLPIGFRNALYRYRMVVARWGAMMVSMPLVLPALAILYLVEPFHRFRICHVGKDAGRIGTLIGVPDHYLRRWAVKGKPPRTTVLFVFWKAENKPLLDMFKGLIYMSESPFLNMVLFAARPLLECTRFLLDQYNEENGHHIDLQVGRHVFLKFTEEQERRGRAYLESVGIGPDDWFICFHAREPEYYDGAGIHEAEKRTHQYRNCSVESYLQAAALACERGGFAIRMGAGITRPLPQGLSPRIIDYAYESHDRFLDIYLCAKAKLFLGNTAGLLCVATAFDVPVGMGNLIPYNTTPLGPRDLWLPKPVLTASGRTLSFSECENEGLFRNFLTSEGLSELFNSRNYFVGENSAEDIRDLCSDMFDLLDGIEPPDEAKRIQSYVRDVYQKDVYCHSILPPISPRFAVKYADLILPQGVGPAHLDDSPCLG